MDLQEYVPPTTKTKRSNYHGYHTTTGRRARLSCHLRAHERTSPKTGLAASPNLAERAQDRDRQPPEGAHRTTGTLRYARRISRGYSGREVALNRERWAPDVQAA